jgi:transposase
MKNETSNLDRRRIVDAYLAGDSVAAIARFLSLNRSTIYLIIRVYKEENRVEKNPRGGSRVSKLTTVDHERIRAMVDADCCLSLREIARRHQEATGVSISKTSVDRCLSSFHYTLKRLHPIPADRNTDRTLGLRAEYVSRFMTLLGTTEQRRILFIDEAGFSVSMRTSRGQSLIGSLANLTIPALCSRNISICAAMSSEGLIHYSVQTCAFNTDSFCDFLWVLMTRLTEEGIDSATLIGDNVAFHRSTRARDIIISGGHHLDFLAPYSPFLNPIENAFSKWKESVRRSNPRSEEELLRGIEQGFLSITPDDCASFSRHLFAYFPRCLNREVILDN